MVQCFVTSGMQERWYLAPLSQRPHDAAKPQMSLLKLSRTALHLWQEAAVLQPMETQDKRDSELKRN